MRLYTRNCGLSARGTGRRSCACTGRRDFSNYDAARSPRLQTDLYCVGCMRPYTLLSVSAARSTSVQRPMLQFFGTVNYGNRAICVVGWSGRLEQSSSGHSFRTYIHYQLSKTCSRRIFSHVPTSLTNCFTEQRTLYGGLIVTLAMLLRLIKCGFIIIIIFYYFYNLLFYWYPR